MIFLKVQISESLETKLEAIVGIMLVALGLNALRKLYQGDTHSHSHTHDGHSHTHKHSHDDSEHKDEHHFWRFSPRSILVGMVHGVAGSAALMLLIVPTIESSWIAMLYILIFGVGSIGGMVLMSLLIGLPLHLTAGKFDRLNKIILCLAGLFSFGLGVFIIYEKLFV